ncbi:hypothetical protein BBAL3_2678 [Brevundimonas sp. BAL3]|nr:hypothetical protein [Brevundimonas sp. BAL3]EDX81521.1 hypothetical protein BBAL3_2678 [Brevundimonas sp. BAL3]
MQDDGMRALSADEIDAVSGGRLKVIMKVISWVLGADLTSDSEQPKPQ